MNTMHMPGFTADKSLLPSGGYYRGAGISRQTDGSIQPAWTEGIRICLVDCRRFWAWGLPCDPQCFDIRIDIPIQQPRGPIPEPGPFVPTGPGLGSIGRGVAVG